MFILDSLTGAARDIARVLVQPADAHCDTEGGPAVLDGRRALATGNANHALRWVSPDREPEVREAFARAVAARTGGPAAAELADRYFLETLVRVHRAEEGASFDGIKPAGTQVPAQVRAADAALETGALEPLRGLVPEQRWAELQRRFDDAVATKGYDVDDLPAARAHTAAYVRFFKYAEGEDHDHDHDHAHAQACGHQS